MNKRPRFATVDEYLASVPADVRPILEKIRSIVRRVVPDAQETISYQMPAFRRRRALFLIFSFLVFPMYFFPVKIQ